MHRYRWVVCRHRDCIVADADGVIVVPADAEQVLAGKAVVEDEYAARYSKRTGCEDGQVIT